MGVDPKYLENELEKESCPILIDVRSGFEYSAGHIPGAVHLPFLKCLFRAAKIIPEKSSDIVVYCEHGPRAQLVSGLLGFLGYRSVKLLDGHMHRWKSENRKTER